MQPRAQHYCSNSVIFVLPASSSDRKRPDKSCIFLFLTKYVDCFDRSQDVPILQIIHILQMGFLIVYYRTTIQPQSSSIAKRLSRHLAQHW